MASSYSRRIEMRLRQRQREEAEAKREERTVRWVDDTGRHVHRVIGGG